MITEKDIALIDEFIAGKLTGSDKYDFEKRVREDREFAAAVRTQIKAIDAIELFATTSFAGELASAMPAIKKGGYGSYSSGLVKIKTIITVVTGVVVITGAFFVYKHFTKAPAAPPSQEMNSPADSVPASKPPALNPTEGSAVETETAADTTTLTQVRTKGDSSMAGEPDMSLNIKDPSSLEVNVLSEKNGIYEYEIKHDGTSQIIQSDQPGLDKYLLNEAKKAMSSSDEQANQPTE